MKRKKLRPGERQKILLITCYEMGWKEQTQKPGNVDIRLAPFETGKDVVCIRRLAEDVDGSQPNGIHLMLSPSHENVADAYLEDLAAAIEFARQDASGGSEKAPARYA